MSEAAWWNAAHTVSRKQRHKRSELEQQQGQAVINKALIATTALVLVSIWDDPGELQPVSLGRAPDPGVSRRQKPLAAQPRA